MIGLQTLHHHPLLNQAMNQAHLLKGHRQCTFLNDRYPAFLLTTIDLRLGQPRLRHQQMLGDLPKSLVSLLKHPCLLLGQLSPRPRRVIDHLVKSQASLIQRFRKFNSRNTRE